MRRFELSDGKSNKFWEIARTGSAFTVRYGKIGTEGRTQEKQFDDEAAARKAAEKMIGQKCKKGYVEVGASADAGGDAKKKSAEAPPAPSAAEREKKSKDASLGHAPSSDKPTKASGPRGGGVWTELLPRGGGRDYVGVEVHRFARNGRFGLSRAYDGSAHRIDLASASSEPLGTLAKGKRNYFSLAISADGAHWAASNGDRWWLDGNPREEVAGPLACGRSMLFVCRARKVVGVDLNTGEERFVADVDKRILAVANDVAVLAAWGSVHFVDANGHVEERKSTHPGPPLRIHARGNKVYVLGGNEREHNKETHVAIWDVDARTERVVALPDHWRRWEFDATEDEVLVLAHAELDLKTGEMQTFEVPKLGTQHGSAGSVCTALAKDDTELWQLWPSGAAVRRLDRKTRAPLHPPPRLPPSHTWSVAVAPDGRIAVGRDGGWWLLSSNGDVLHHEALEQAPAIAFSPDGSRLAVFETPGDKTHVVDARTLETIAKKKLPCETLVFSDDGARLLAIQGKKAWLCSADTLDKQHCLTAKGYLREAHWSEGAIVAHDDDGRVYRFDDPGPGPAEKKPPKHKPAVVVSRANARAYTTTPSVELADGELVVCEPETLVRYDGVSKKPVSKQAGETTFAAGGRILVRREALGASLWRLGERAPFALLDAWPTLVAATPDARRVVAEVHHGLALWTETGASMPETGSMTAQAEAPPVELPGFAASTWAIVAFGNLVQVRFSEAEALARGLLETASGLVAVPEGDASETTGYSADQVITMCIGVEVARTEADPHEQGVPSGDEVAFRHTDAQEAAAAWAAARDDVRTRAEVLAPSLSWEDSEGLHLVPSGQLALAELCADDGSVRSNGETADRVRDEMLRTLELDGERFALRAQYD